LDLNSDELLDALQNDLQEKIRLEQERRDLEARRQAETHYISDALRRLNALGDKFAQALGQLEQYQQIDDIIRELTIELPRQLDRLERILLVILAAQTGKTPKRDTAELEADILKQHTASLRRRAGRLQKSLDILQEQRAAAGLQPPVNITNQIYDIEQELRNVKSEIEFFKDG
jgi:chromosome segregation ATPase